MDLGVLHFSYRNFTHFQREFEEKGVFSINLGDYMQTLAVRDAYRAAGVDPARVTAVDRDGLASYDGPPVILPLNGCIFGPSFPIAEQITPIFIGFQAKEPAIRKNASYLKRFQPVGCRDVATAERCRAHGIEAYVTGCLTLAFEPRSAEEAAAAATAGAVFIVYGAGAGAFPTEILGEMPADLVRDAEFVSQRRDMTRFPLSAEDCAGLEAIAAALYRRYRTEAARVVTPLHHAATPCMAAGIPVVLARRAADDRFSYLESLIPTRIAPDFDGIDWRAPAVDLSEPRARLRALFAEQLARALDAAGAR